MPKEKTVSDIKSNILQPATTSHFEVTIPLPNEDGFRNFLSANGVNFPADQEQLNLLCSEAVLPGSSLATLELDNDYTGVTERHAHRRVFDDRIDLTFYVDAKNYLPIKVFESWIKYISGEEISVAANRGVGVKAKNYFYRIKYPDTYIADSGLSVTKFEKDFSTRRGGKNLKYSFVRAFPISIGSIPVSYDSSSLLKCSVSFTYIRYYIESLTNTIAPSQKIPSQTTPAQQAIANNSVIVDGINEQGYATVYSPFGSSVTFFDGNDGQLDF